MDGTRMTRREGCETSRGPKKLQQVVHSLFRHAAVSLAATLGKDPQMKSQRTVSYSIFQSLNGVRDNSLLLLLFLGIIFKSGPNKRTLRGNVQIFIPKILLSKTIITPRRNEQKHLSLSCSARLSCHYFSLLFSSLATNNVKVER